MSLFSAQTTNLKNMLFSEQYKPVIDKKIYVILAIQKPSHTFTKIHLKGLLTNKLNILFLLSFTVFINTLTADGSGTAKNETKN